MAPWLEGAGLAHRDEDAGQECRPVAAAGAGRRPAQARIAQGARSFRPPGERPPRRAVLAGRVWRWVDGCAAAVAARRARPRRRAGALGASAPAAGFDANSRIACMAAAYPAAKASRRTASICCCNWVRAVCAIAHYPPYKSRSLTTFATLGLDRRPLVLVEPLPRRAGFGYQIAQHPFAGQWIERDHAIIAQS